MRLGIFVLGCIVIGILSFELSVKGFETKVVGEQLCVDGNQNINLEGIMCEKTETTWFGLNYNFSFLVLLPVIIWGIIGLLKVD